MKIKSRSLLLISAALIALCAYSLNSSATASPPKADKDMQKVLDSLASLNPKPIEKLSAEQARKQPSPADAVKKLMREDGKNPDDDMGVVTKDITIKGAKGNLPARIYRPKDSENETLPIVVYYHGGGWVIADLDVYDATPRAMAKMAKALVISAHYRQAPEHKFPAAHDDAFAAYKWVVNNAKELGGDSSQIAVMGESAGANLAINTAIAARDNNVQMPVYQVLVYPVAGVNMNTESYQENADAKPLNKAMMKWFVEKVIKSEDDKNDARIDLVGKADLKNLPATTIITAEIDPLRSEGLALAEKLEDAGVSVNKKDYKGVTHEFFGMGAVVSKAKDAQELAADDLKAAFNE